MDEETMNEESAKDTTEEANEALEDTTDSGSEEDAENVPDETSQ